MGGQGQSVEPAMGVELQQCTHNIDSDQTTIVLGADVCLWLGEPIPIINMLIHRITILPHSRLNLAKTFGRKMGQCNLTKRMKDKLKLTKKPCGYLIYNIIDPLVKVAT